MSTAKIQYFVGLLVCCVVSPVAWGQYDTPPTLPDWSAEPAPVAKPVFPELPVAPQATTPAPLPVVRQRKVVAPRPRALSAESTASLPKQVQNVIDFYGGATSARALAQLPQRPSSGSARSTPVHSTPARQRRKPFEGTVAGAPSTISPYMNLFLEESAEGIPNYHAYVRPVQQQRATNRSNRQRLSSLQRQVQQVSYGESVQQTNGGSVPGTGHGTRYFNTTQFYPETPRLR